MFRKLTILAAAAAAALTLSAGAAQAAVHPDATSGTTVYTRAGVTPVSGYYVFGNRFSALRTDITTNLLTENLTPGVTNGLGGQLCNPNTGYGAGVGLVLNPDGVTFSVDWAAGTFASAIPNTDATNGDPCLWGILPGPAAIAPQLAHVPDGDKVQLDLSYNIHSGWLTFGATDLTTDTNSWTHSVNVGKFREFREAGSGVEADTALLSAPASNLIASMSSTWVRDYAGAVHDFGDTSLWTAVQVDSTGSGLGPASQSLLTPAGSLHFSTFRVNAGTPTG